MFQMSSKVFKIILTLLNSIHLACTDVPLGLIVDSPLNKNFIFEPQIVKELKANLLKHQTTQEELVKMLYEKHAYDYLFYICNGCVKSFGFAKIKNNCKQEVFLKFSSLIFF
jgi:hypothetical protein